MKLSEVCPHITVLDPVGSPPSQYDVRYEIKGLFETENGISERVGHVARFKLPSGYPREAPVCHMLTPVFHPNIAPHAVCIVDYWTAGESLPDLIIRVGEMISYQSYNVKSPLNGEAAKWASEHISRFPIDAVDLAAAYALEDVIVTVEDIERLASQVAATDETQALESVSAANTDRPPLVVPPRRMPVRVTIEELADTPSEYRWRS